MILVGVTGGRCVGLARPTRRPSAATRSSPSAHDLDGVAVEQDAAILHAPSENRLQSNDFSTLQSDRPPGRATFAYVSARGNVMSESFDRVRVLWPDHLGLARGKYVPASLAAERCRATAPARGRWATTAA